MKMKSFFFLAFLLLPFILFAHPHTFMDMRIGVMTDESGITGFKIEWQFDYFFSSSIMSECDWDMNGKFNAEELDYLEYFAFNNLENYHYFTTIIHNGKTTYPKKYRNFKAWCKGDLLWYSFVIPYKAPLSDLQELSIGLYDDTFYCDVAFFPEKSFYWTQEQRSGLSAKIGKAKKTITYDNGNVSSQRSGAIYTGTVVPDVLYIFANKE